MSLAIVSGADAGFFSFLFELVRSVRDKVQGRGVPLCIFDSGLSQEQRDWLHGQGATIQRPRWPYRCELSSTDQLLATRPQIPDYFPGHDIYVWIDADAWVQRWEAIETFCAGAAECGFCVAPEWHPNYRLTKYWGIDYARAWYGPPPGGTREVPLNAGVFAGRADAPHWKAWLQRVAEVVERPSFDPNSHFALDQAALNVVLSRDGFACSYASEANNFLCNHAVPKVSEDGAQLLDPRPPYLPLGIVHNAGKEKKRFAVLSTPTGSRLSRGFTYVAPSILPPGDYVSAGLSLMLLDACFPNMIKGDPSCVTWPHFRHGIRHNWYVDKNDPLTGFLNRDEVHILYNTALQFRDRRALEIGCHMGWSACHLAAAGVHLDVIDPALAKQQIQDSVRSSLEMSAPANPIRLLFGRSPETVAQLANEGTRWSLFFIDGDHESPAPLHDAMVCERYAEPDALMLFHDLAAPAVAEGLAHLRRNGWKTRIYQTAQIMAAAWRGSVRPVDHQPDPAIAWSIPDHLRQFLSP